MERYYKSFTVFALGVSSWISSKLGILGPLLIGFTVLMIVDYMTGMMAAAIESIEHPDDENYGWSSKKGRIGIIKKVSYIMIIAACMIADYVIVVGIEAAGWNTPIKGFFSILVTLWYILEEFLSIMENVKRMHADVPEWAIKYIAVMKNSIDHKFDYMNEGGERDAGSENDT